jgi:hypothetical protein
MTIQFVNRKKELQRFSREFSNHFQIPGLNFLNCKEMFKTGEKKSMRFLRRVFLKKSIAGKAGKCLVSTSGTWKRFSKMFNKEM